MTDKTLGVVAIGNAVVDMIAHVDDDFLDNHGDMTKGTMALIDEDRATDLTAMLSDPIQTSGGSAANTMAGFASFGGQGGFIGKVADDEIGTILSNDIKSLGLSYETKKLPNNNKTGRCVILVTPDGERTMNTFLGASTELHAEDVDEGLIKQARILYMEGYLFDKDTAKQAFIHAAQIARDNGVQVALTLSDPFCVDRHRDDFKNLVENHVDILFANEDEITSLYQANSFDDAKNSVSNHVKIAALTRSENGAVILHDGKEYSVSAAPVAQVVDSTGAGDQFAAGFLYGLTQGMDINTCGKLAAQAAAEVISHVGPRPQVPYADFLKDAA